MDLGEIKLHLLSDGMHRHDGGSLFGLVPKTLWSRVATADGQNFLGSEMQCLLIETRGQQILVDTGSGSKPRSQPSGRTLPDGGGRLLESLAEQGVEATEIDLVINTHLHADSCGGNTRCDGEGKPVPTFPKAEYCVQRLELAEASFPNERTRTAYLRENVEPIQRSGQLRVLSGDTRLADCVRVIVTPGHTRAHQSVIIEGGRRTALFLGDAAPWPVHLERLSWVPAYDTEPLVSIETKRTLARWAIEHQALLIFGQRPVVGYLQATGREDRFRLEPVQVKATG